jgi:hypothetical protein
MQEQSGLSRRDFTKLTLAALGGVCAGSYTALQAADSKPTSKNPLLGDKHVCRGLNTCKGKGSDKKNACAGTGQCAVAAKHTCGGGNECKGQGGCGEHPGENSCKGQGDCHVPLSKAAWKKARKRFEELMTAEGKKFGKAPEKKKSDD